MNRTLFDKFRRTSYRFFGAAADRVQIPGLHRNLKKSRLYITESMYISMMIFSIIGIAASGFVGAAAIFILDEYGKINPENTVFIYAGIFFSTIILLIGTLSMFLLIPYLKAADNKFKIERQLPFATNYMAAIAAAGVRTEIIFQSFSRKKSEKIYDALSIELKTIEIQTNWLGKDYPSALQTLSEETVSPLFSEFIVGVKNTMISGGSFQKYIQAKKHDYQSRAGRRKEKYFQTLEMFSEIYLIVFLSMPIFFMILFYAMMPLSGPDVEKMTLLTYRIVPFLGILFLLILDIINENEEA